MLLPIKASLQKPGRLKEKPQKSNSRRKPEAMGAHPSGRQPEKEFPLVNHHETSETHSKKSTEKKEVGNFSNPEDPENSERESGAGCRDLLPGHAAKHGSFSGNQCLSGCNRRRGNPGLWGSNQAREGEESIREKSWHKRTKKAEETFRLKGASRNIS